MSGDDLGTGSLSASELQAKMKAYGKNAAVIGKKVQKLNDTMAGIQKEKFEAENAIHVKTKELRQLDHEIELHYSTFCFLLLLEHFTRFNEQI